MAETLAPGALGVRTRLREISETEPLKDVTTIKCLEVPLFALYYAKCLRVLDLF
jgi:hypothetical protein